LIILDAVVLKNLPAVTLVDTGCSRSLLDLSRLHVTPRASWHRVRVAITTAQGTLADKPAWVIPKLEIVVKGVRAWATNALGVAMPQLPYGMLLGMDFLSAQTATIQCDPSAVCFPSGVCWLPRSARFQLVDD
jgi:hypothetical protein